MRNKYILIIALVLLLSVGLLAFTACGLFGSSESNGIKSIEKTNTDGLVDTYTITLTNGETSTFTVTNGKNGKNADSSSSDPNAATPDEYFRFNLLEDGTYEVLARFNDMPTRVVIPATHNGKKVTKIANNGFYNDNYYQNSTDEFIISEGITHIGDGAFSRNRFTTKISIPSTVTYIGSEAFNDCEKLELTKKDGISYLGSEGKPYAVMMKAENKELTTCTLPNGVISIERRAFEGCSSLTSVTIPATLTNVGYSVFEGCNRLTSIHYQGTLATWCGIESGLQYLMNGKTLYIGGKKLEGEIAIPAGVKSIPSCAFYNCSDVTSITIPAGVTEIGSAAFYGCSNLTAVTIPAGVTTIEDSAFYNCSALSSVTIPAGVTRIGYYAFENCSSLTSVTIPAGVTEIGSRTFYGCFNLTAVTIPAGVTRIGYSAFQGCSSLTSVTIPAGVKEIGSDAFYGCSKLTTVDYQGTLADWCSLQGSYNLMAADRTLYIKGSKIQGNVIIPEGVTSIGDYAFKNCADLTSVSIPDGVTSIGSYAFSGCTSLTSISIPASVKSIGNHSFAGCTSLTEIAIPDGVTRIGEYAFSGCSGLTEITIPASVTTIGYSAFYGCTSLTSIEIPEGVKELDYYVFYGCSSLSSVTLPKSLVSIGSSPFSGTALTEITYNGTVADWNKISKSSNWSSLTVHCTDDDVI